MSLLVILSSLLLFSGPFRVLAINNIPRTTDCKAVPGTPEWPAFEIWNRLNISTAGRLLHVPPPGAVCHQDRPTYNATQCPAVQTAWFTFPFHVDNPISSIINEFNNDSCLPWPIYPCSGEGYPVYVINATTPAHVKLGIDFAHQYNIRLIVKDSGHDYLGRSSAPNSLSIWTHHMAGTTLHLNGFQPQGCPDVVNTSAITSLGGTSTIDVFTATDAVNQTVVGGGSGTIGMGGYLTGGGHGLLSARYGLATDQVLEMEVVTPSGDIVIANACQNKDLFWAMRGGGGSTFGIMTSVTMKTFPSPSLVSILISIGTTDASNPASFDVFAYILSQFPSLSDAGVSGYGIITPPMPNPANSSGTIARLGGVFFLQDTQDESAILALWEPIVAHVTATWPGWSSVNSTSTYPSLYSWWVNHQTLTGAGPDYLIGSRLLDATALTANLTAAAEAWQRFTAGGVGTAYLVSGKGVFDAQPAGGSDALLPAWRKAYVHATNAVGWNPTNSTQKTEQIALLKSYVGALRELAPDMGAYINEADPYEPNWQETFWGDNYPRLLEIKRALDPDDVFWCHPCVGSEGWQEVGNMLCRV